MSADITGSTGDDHWRKRECVDTPHAALEVIGHRCAKKLDVDMPAKTAHVLLNDSLSKDRELIEEGKNAHGQTTVFSRFAQNI